MNIKNNLKILLLIFFPYLLFGQRISPEVRIDNNYIGGFYNANVNQPLMYNGLKRNISVVVNSKDELVNELKVAKKGSVIFLAGDKTFDLTGLNKLAIPDGVSLLSDRGSKYSKGALVFTNDLATSPLFVANGDNILISGIRFQGPDSAVLNPGIAKARAVLKKGDPKAKLSEARFNTYGVPNSVFLEVNNRKNIEIENCEIFYWSHAGINISNNSKVIVHHCYIHHNQRTGLGYGILVDKSNALIRGNIFDYNRHAIAGTGNIGTSYNAEFNIVLANSTNQGHAFDMHGGADRKDGTNVAGDFVKITNNTFYYKNTPVIKVRGVPRQSSIVSNNNFIRVKGGRVSGVMNNTVQQSGGKRGNLLIKDNNYQ